MASEIGGNARRRVTRDVEPRALRDLLEHPLRATVAFVDRDTVELLPVRARFNSETHRFGVLPGAAPDLDDLEVVLVIDDGPYWFELRGISVRGIAKRIDRPEPGDTGGHAWYSIEPRRMLAWDYGTVREE